MARPRVTCVIMAGGRGTRLWPMVHAKLPKVWATLDGRTSLLERTLNRVAPVSRSGGCLIVATHALARPIRRSLPARWHHALISEPEGKSTAACIALAAAILAAQDPERIMVVLPADHWIEPAVAFRRSLAAAIETATAHPRLVTIWLKPAHAHPGLGYLCAGKARGTRQGCRTFELTRMIEKPSAARAGRLIRQGRAYWNAGIFVGRVRTFLDAITQWLPEHARQILPLGAKAGRPSFLREAARAYRNVPAISFDHGVMAHLREGDIVEGTFRWEDLGSWDSWVRISRRVAPSVGIASRNVHVVSTDHHLVATVGLEDTIIVRTSKATLVCRTQDAQAVQALVGRLERDPRLARYL